MFLSTTQDDLLSQLAILRNGYYENKNGTQTKAKLFFLGENVCTLAEVYFRFDKNNKMYLGCVFVKSPEFVHGLKTKLSFIRHTEYIFNEEKVIELCAAFGHELKPKPDTMPFNDYIGHVYRRVKTFIGKELKVAIRYEKERKTDDFGDSVMRQVYYDRQDEVWFWRMKIDMFYGINEQKEVDWLKISSIFAE